MRTKAIQIRYGFDEPIEVIDPIQSNVAFSAKKATDAFFASPHVTAARMIVVNMKAFILCSIGIGVLPAYTALVSLCGVHLSKPLFGYAVLVESDCPDLLSPVFRTTPFHELSISLGMIAPVLSRIPQAFFFVFAIALSARLIMFLAVLFDPFIMRFSGALLASRIKAKLAAFDFPEIAKGKFLETTSTLPGGGVDLFRGHDRSSKAIRIRPARQRLTPLSYHLEAIYGR